MARQTLIYAKKSADLKPGPIGTMLKPRLKDSVRLTQMLAA